MRCRIRYHLYNLKNMKNSHGGVLPLVQFQALGCNFTKTFTFLKLYKWYQIAQRISYNWNIDYKWVDVSFKGQLCYILATFTLL